MRIKGQECFKDYSQEILLPRPGGEAISLKISPLPLGFHRRLRKQGIVSPQPPRRVARDSNQQPIRDERGQAVFMEHERDEAYVEALEMYHQRIAVLMIAEALSSDGNVEFATEIPVEGNLVSCADALYVELEESGFQAGDLILLCNEIGKLSNLFDEHLGDSQQHFLSEVHQGRRT